METFSWAFRDDDPELRKFAERADLTELAKRVDPARLTELEAEYKVFFDLSSSILTLCIIIAEAMRPYIGADGYEKTRRFVHIYFECAYFFLHLTNRFAHGRLSEDQFDGLHEHLIPLVAVPAIQTFCVDGSDELKAEMLDEFYQRLNGAELEYGGFKKVEPETELDTDAALSRFCKNISELSGNASDVTSDVYVTVYTLAVAACQLINVMDFPNKMEMIKVILNKQLS